MHFRYARHTTHLKVLKQFYCEILKLEVIGSFSDHNGYDGLFLGKRGADWHLEFTKSEQTPVHQVDEDDLLVFYPETHQEYDAIMAGIREAGLEFILSKNPYWIEHGVCIKDPDGFRVMISRQRVKG